MIKHFLSRVPSLLVILMGMIGLYQMYSAPVGDFVVVLGGLVEFTKGSDVSPVIAILCLLTCLWSLRGINNGV
jgi:hypothetical protein